MEKEILVYIDLHGKQHFVGRLWSRAKKGRESSTFEYSRDWLNYPERFALEPALMLVDGPQHTPIKKAIFGSLGDSAPDRWGRVLMRRAERRRAKENKSTPRTLLEIDYLLQVNDHSRQGSLRFKENIDGPFLANDSDSIPPLIKLPKLLNATQRLINEEDTAADLRLLLAPGSSLGGARPKALVCDQDGSLAIAKFPHKEDENNNVLWEALALRLAKKAKIIVPDWRVEKILDKDVLISRRFDRIGKVRSPYLSAMSMLGANDNEVRSYLEIADALRQYSQNFIQDLQQLWRRIVFNIMISNTDDHLRNHGFLYNGAQGWRLSPAFDLNPVPIEVKPRILSTNIDLHDSTASLELAFSVAEYFGLDTASAKQISAEVDQAVATWAVEAKQLGIKKSEIQQMASAFEHQDRL